MTYKIGIDVGGTFTDLFLWSEDGSTRTHKTLSTPGDPATGVLEGLAALAAAEGLAPAEFAARVTLIVHGTTVTTNALLTRSGASTGLLTTAGVRDALEMRRGIRERQYDNRFTNVVPLVPRRLRRPISGRLECDGSERKPLDLDEVRREIEVLRDAQVEALAICFMHSYADARHERAVAELARALLPEAYVSVSSELLPVIRFYDRVSTTVLNSYVGPVLRRYLESLTARLAAGGFGGVLLVMQSNGGVALPAATLERAAATLLSGPAAGPRAAAVVAGSSGGDAILVDMGGTSFDASLVQCGAATLKSAGEIDRLRVALPMLDITTIGAGGGSIAWLDAGGLLRVGPASAGAAPGPACYGRGGSRPTCTDADLLLGYLDPDLFAGGRLRLDAGLARAAVEEFVARPLGLAVDQAAAGIYRVINSNMAHGVREVTVRRGLDPREFPLVVAGGAGALHACRIATELEIPRVIVPAFASTLCATGMLFSELRHDFVRSYVTPLAAAEPRRLHDLIAAMTAAGGRQLAAAGIAHVAHEVELDLRYLKQYHEVTVPAAAAALAAGDYAEVARAFHRRHDALYGYSLEDQGTGLELINVRVRSLGRAERPVLPRLAAGDADAGHARKGRRRAWLPEAARFGEVPVYDGERLLDGNRVAGPALIERADTTIVVTGSFDAAVDPLGSVILERRDSREAT